MEEPEPEYDPFWDRVAYVCGGTAVASLVLFHLWIILKASV